jgi:hypothetical protein
MVELSWLLLATSLATASDPAVSNGTAAAENEMTAKERRVARREERRRLRRERRAQGKAGAHADENGFIEVDPDPETQEETEENLEQGMGKAGGTAQKLGDLLKKTLNGTAEDLPHGKSLGQALTGSLGSGGGGRSSSGSGALDGVPMGHGESKTGGVSIPNVANPDPKNKQDLLASVRSGFNESLDASGLKVGADKEGRATIVSGDGSPAGQGQLDALAEHISKEPVMLTKRPDFFKVLPRQKFQDLKRDIKKPDGRGEAVFKDVALTSQDRDFAWSQSCGGVNGGCNTYVSRSSYRGGDYVEPEDLGQLWKSMREEKNPSTAVASSDANNVNAKSIRAKLNIVLGGIKQIFVDTKGQKPGGAAGVTGSGSSVAGVFISALNWGAKSDKQIVYTEVQKKEATVVPGKTELAAAVNTDLPPEKVPAAGMGLGLAVVGLAALAFKRALG